MIKEIILSLLIFTSVFHCKSQTPNTQPANWQLIFEDNFNDSDIDDDNWSKLWPWGNGDWDACRTTDGNNTQISNGILELISKKEDYEGTVFAWDEEGGTFSAKIESFDYYMNPP